MYILFSVFVNYNFTYKMKWSAKSFKNLNDNKNCLLSLTNK